MALSGALEYPELERLVVESGGLDKDSVRAVARASLPMLTRLELWTGSSTYGGTSTVEDVTPLLDGRAFPRLVELGFRNSEYTDGFCKALATAPIAARLRTLDLSMGTMSDAGVEALVDARERLTSIKMIGVSDNYVSEAGLAALAALGVEVVNRAGYKQADSDRYVSVGE